DARALGARGAGGLVAGGGGVLGQGGREGEGGRRGRGGLGHPGGLGPTGRRRGGDTRDEGVRRARKEQDGRGDRGGERFEHGPGSLFKSRSCWAWATEPRKLGLAARPLHWARLPCRDAYGQQCDA